MLLAVAATGAALLLVEIGVRVLAWASEARRREAWLRLAEMPRLPAGEPAKLAHVIRPSPNARRVYELIPGLDVQFQGAHVRTDAAGRRCGDATPPPAGTARTVRIVGIGDSVMFGWGVAEADGFLRQLERLLRERHAQLAWQATNTAVPGYNTVMEVETLKDTSLQPPPDLVVLDFVGNDFDLPNFIAHRTDYWSPSTSFLLEWIVSVQRGFDTQAFRPLELAPKRAEGLFVGDPARVPAQYRDMVGVDAFRRALTELHALAQQHGFAVVASCHLFFDETVQDALTALRIPLAENGHAVARHQHEHGIATYQGALTVSATDPHPNALVHGLQAETIYRALVDSGVLARLLTAK